MPQHQHSVGSVADDRVQRSVRVFKKSDAEPSGLAGSTGMTASSPTKASFNNDQNSPLPTLLQASLDIPIAPRLPTVELPEIEEMHCQDQNFAQAEAISRTGTDQSFLSDIGMLCADEDMDVDQSTRNVPPANALMIRDIPMKPPQPVVLKSDEVLEDARESLLRLRDRQLSLPSHTALGPDRTLHRGRR